LKFADAERHLLSEPLLHRARVLGRHLSWTEPELADKPG